MYYFVFSNTRYEIYREIDPCQHACIHFSTEIDTLRPVLSMTAPPIVIPPT